MNIIPVMDLMGGVVVRGVGGRRHEYRPISSSLATNADPMVIARAFRQRFGLQEIYLADLDAIAGQPPALRLYEKLADDGFRLWVDAGLREVSPAQDLIDHGVWQVVAGLETLPDPQILCDLVHSLPRAKVVFSLDLKQGKPLRGGPGWEKEPMSIARQAIGAGVRRLIILDLAHVGGGAGTGTEKWCAELIPLWPDVEFTVGGGIRGPQDLRRLHKLHVHHVLVASALHDGLLRREDFKFAPGP